MHTHGYICLNWIFVLQFTFPVTGKKEKVQQHLLILIKTQTHQAKGKVSIQSVCIIDDKNMAAALNTTCSLAETNKVINHV